MPTPEPPDEKPARPLAPETAAEHRAVAAWHDARMRYHAMMAEAHRRSRDGALRVAEGMEGGRGPLRIIRDASTVTGNMVTDRRLAISKGRTGKDKFAAAYRQAGYTLRSLAEAVGCSHTMLSMHRTDPERKIPQKRADKVATLIDWPADRAHWPFGFAS